MRLSNRFTDKTLRMISRLDTKTLRIMFGWMIKAMIQMMIAMTFWGLIFKSRKTILIKYHLRCTSLFKILIITTNRLLKIINFTIKTKIQIPISNKIKFLINKYLFTNKTLLINFNPTPQIMLINSNIKTRSSIRAIFIKKIINIKPPTIKAKLNREHKITTLKTNLKPTNTKK